MPLKTVKKAFQKFERTMDKLEAEVTNTVSKKAHATYENGRDIASAAWDNAQMTKPLPLERRDLKKAMVSRGISGLSRKQRYKNANDLHVMEAERRAKMKFPAESGAILPTAGIAGVSTALTLHTGGLSGKLAFLQFTSAANHSGKAASSFARAAVIESERMRRGLPEPRIPLQREFKRGAQDVFATTVQRSGLTHAASYALGGLEHVTHLDTLRDRLFDSPTYAAPTNVPNYPFKQSPSNMPSAPDGRTYMYTPIQYTSAQSSGTYLP